MAAMYGPIASYHAKPHIPDYEMLRLIGRGGYGDVWIARGVTGIFRAIKVVWRDRFPDAAPFEREFKGLTEFAAISLGESIQLALLHVGRNDTGGYFYYVMELADDADRGRDILPDSYVPLTLTEARKRRGRLPVPESLGVGVELARVLAGLHRRGLVHRDIKPSNVILVGGVAKLADIGLVTAAADATTFVGTEGFVPPEGPGTPGADVFALGKLLYELSTGLDRQQFPMLPADVRRLPDSRGLFELNEILLRACERDAANRYADGAALLADLLELQAGGSMRGRRLGRVMTRSAAAAAILATCGWAAWRWRPRPAASPGSGAPLPAAAIPLEKSLAVLPFTNLGGDRDQDYFSEGLAEEILNALARERDLRVPGRTSSFSFKGRDVSESEIARSLGVSRLVEGSVQRSGGKVRIRVSLTRVADNASETIGTFTDDLTDIFALQDKVARAVVEKVTHRPSAHGIEPLTRNAEAYDAYLRGRAVQVRSGNSSNEARPLYERAVALDPNFAMAWVRLAEVRYRRFSAGFDWSPDLAPTLKTMIDRALEAQPDLPEALVMRATWTRSFLHDYAAAWRDLDKVESMQPATVDLRAAQGNLALAENDWDRGLRFLSDAMMLDPRNGDHALAYGHHHFWRGNFAEADRLYTLSIAIEGTSTYNQFRVALRLVWRGPQAALRLLDRSPPDWRGRALWRAKLQRALGHETGTVADALAPDAAARAERARSDAENELRKGNRSPGVYVRLVDAEIALGHPDSALKTLDDWRRAVQPEPSTTWHMFDFNFWAMDDYARLGQVDQALALMQEWLDNGFQFTRSLRYEPDYASLRSNPRFQGWMRQQEAWAKAQPDPPDL